MDPNGHKLMADRLKAIGDLSPQCQTLYMHLAQNPEKGITILEAGHLYKVAFSAVPRRMADIRQALEPVGITIRADRRVDPTGHRYTRYFLEINGR